MSHMPSKIGYCSSCMKNIPHVRRLGNPTLWMLDLATLRIAKLLRLGPWYCIQCNQRELYLSVRRRSVEDYDPADPLLVESAGNYIHTTESLVMRRNRAARYSQKYRDGVVQRLISGTVTISQIGQELNLTERDIVDWIADALANKQERIEQLVAILRSVQQAHRDQARIAVKTATFVDESGSVIEGEFDAKV